VRWDEFQILKYNVNANKNTLILFTAFSCCHKLIVRNRKKSNVIHLFFLKGMLNYSFAGK
jgi:hypothetical protein